MAGRIHVSDEPDISAQRQPSNLPARTALVRPPGDFPAKSDRELLGTDAENARYPLVAQFVKEHEGADRKEEGDQDEP